MGKKSIQRRLGRNGKYPGLITQVKRTFSSKDSNIEQALRDFFDASRPTIEETIDKYESNALAIIEDEGYEVKKPYKFGDSYAHDKGEALLVGLIQLRIGDEGRLTPLGYAAQIITDCHHLRESMKNGNAEDTAHNAMLLQQSVDYLNFMQWEYPARVGEYQLIAKNVRFSDEIKSLWQERFENLKRGNPAISKRKAAEIIGKELGHNPESIRKNIKK